MGPAERQMKSFHEGPSSSNRVMARERRPNPLLAVQADFRLPDQIRRPALVAAGRGPHP